MALFYVSGNRLNLSNFCFALLAFLFVAKSHAQEAEPVIPPLDTDTVYSFVEKMPVFAGGNDSMYRFINRNIRYPKYARDNQIQGRVFISFIVDKSGILRKIQLERGIGGGCDEEAMRVLKMMPNWKPGMQNGEHVNVKCMLPISFALEIVKEGDPRIVSTSPSTKRIPLQDLVIEKTPSFPGGDQKMNKFIAKSKKNPGCVDQEGIRGTVAVTFLVDSTGAIQDVKVLNGLNDECDKEALRLVRSFPRWQPGTQNGAKVSMQCNVTIPFGDELPKQKATGRK